MSAPVLHEPQSPDATATKAADALVRVPEAKLAIFQSCLRRTRAGLKAAGKDIDAEIVAELLAVLSASEVPEEFAGDPDAHPVFAVSAAYITAMALNSIDESLAAQTLARRLVTAGYELPKQGGDSRGWKRLLFWRDQLERNRLRGELRLVYDRALKFAGQAPTQIDLKAALDFALRSDGGAAAG